MLQLILMLVLSIAVAGFTYGLAHEIRDYRLTPVSFVRALVSQSPEHHRLMRNWMVGDGGFWFLIAFAIASFAAGVWLRASLGHWRWPRPLLAWITVISGLIWIKLLLWPPTWVLRKITGEVGRYDGLTFSQSLGVAQVLAVSVVITLLGTTVGFGLARLGAGLERRRFVKRLIKLRKRRRAE